MPNTVYDNYFLSREIEDQFNSRIDLMGFVTVDRSLEGVAGMTRKVNVYSATGGAEKLEMGEGNTESIEVTYSPASYEIALAQSRFVYYDEQEMTDPFAIQTGINYMAVDMFNTVNADIYTEFGKATLAVTASAPDFAAFADAQALLNSESVETLNTFAFANPADIANIRKALNEDLRYVEAYARNGYVGTVAGTNVYQKKDATPGEIILATPEAVTVFLKKGTEIESSVLNNRSAADANTRLNTIFARKYYLAALTNATKAVKINVGGGSI